VRAVRTAALALVGVASLGLGFETVASATSSTSGIAAPACNVAAEPLREVARIPFPGEFEALAVDDRGRMFATDLLNQYVWRIDRPGATPVVLAKGFNSMGGIVVRPDGKLLVGTGNDPITGTTGYLKPSAKIFLVDPETGAKSVFAVVRSANGLAQGPDGTVYASNLFGNSIARIRPNGAVDLDWARMLTPNGLAVAPDNSALYVARTVVDGAVTRVPIGNPDAPTNIAATSGLDAAAFPDGLTVDSAGTPIVATHLGGIWRVENDGTVCVLASGVWLSSNVGYGRGTEGFSAGRQFRVGFDGVVHEIPAGFDPAATE
jgi:gluconolactonase